MTYHHLTDAIMEQLSTDWVTEAKLAECLRGWPLTDIAVSSPSSQASVGFGAAQRSSTANGSRGIACRMVLWTC